MPTFEDLEKGNFSLAQGEEEIERYHIADFKIPFLFRAKAFILLTNKRVIFYATGNKRRESILLSEVKGPDRFFFHTEIPVQYVTGIKFYFLPKWDLTNFIYFTLLFGIINLIWTVIATFTLYKIILPHWLVSQSWWSRFVAFLLIGFAIGSLISFFLSYKKHFEIIIYSSSSSPGIVVSSSGIAEETSGQISLMFGEPTKEIEKYLDDFMVKVYDIQQGIL